MVEHWSHHVHVGELLAMCTKIAWRSRSGFAGSGSISLVSSASKTTMGRPASISGLKDTVPERPYHSNHWISELQFKSVRIQQNYNNFSEILISSRTSQHFLECSPKFRKKSFKSEQNSMKIVEKKFLQKFEQKCEKRLTNFCKDFEFG